MRTLMLCSALLFTTAARAEGNTEPRTVGAFHAVAVSAGIGLEASASATASVAVRGAPEDRAEVVTEVVDGTLRASWRPHAGSSNHRDTVLVVSVPKLDAIATSGGSAATVRGLPVEALSASGGGSIHAQDLRGTKLAVQVSGGGSAVLAGSGVDSLQLSASGGATVDASKLPARSLAVSGSGGGEVQAQATESVSASASGGTHVRVLGKPHAVAKNASGGGSVDID